MHASFPLEQPRSPILFVDLNDYTFLAYASIYFQREKTRLFHSSTLQELITFTSQVPIQPLHRVANARVNSVLEVERKVLMFIKAIAQEAEDAALSENNDLLEQICFQSLTSQEMFDEIVCFVMKETNGNPSEESQQLAFHLLFVLLSQRRPSSHLLHYIVYYIYLQLSQSGAIGGLAVSIMRVLLSDDLRYVDGTYSIQRFQWVCDESRKAATSAFCSSLFDGTSIETINLTEEVAELLLRHGIMPPTDNSYGIDIELRRNALRCERSLRRHAGLRHPADAGGVPGGRGAARAHGGQQGLQGADRLAGRDAAEASLDVDEPCEDEAALAAPQRGERGCGRGR